MKLILKITIVIVGAGLGFAYYYFIGCNSGTCPITSNPWVSTTYGAIIGLVLTFGHKTNKNESTNTDKE